ncbi:MAG: tellurite resistance protein TehB [Methanomassiliicoccales archaeon PtaU1.Bin124]|nr:MAG: tellurite resistance protein TehB [Methanomassiliicoccales archaeon PtaU1.Bin124]
MIMTGRRSEGQQRQWETTYVQKDFFGSKPSELAESVLPLMLQEKVRDVVELGCGQGRDTWYFARNGLFVTAMDYSEAGICQLRDRANDMNLGNIKGQVHDVRDGLPFQDNSIDAIYSHMLMCMELSDEELQSIMDECFRVLRPGGLKIFSVRNDHDPHYGKFDAAGKDMWRNPMGFVVHFFTKEQIESLAKGWEIVHIKEFEDRSPPFTKKLYEVVLRKPKRTVEAF